MRYILSRYNVTLRVTTFEEPAVVAMDMLSVSAAWRGCPFQLLQGAGLAPQQQQQHRRTRGAMGASQHLPRSRPPSAHACAHRAPHRAPRSKPMCC